MIKTFGQREETESELKWKLKHEYLNRNYLNKKKFEQKFIQQKNVFF